MIGANEIIIIAVLLLIFLGPTKIPEFAKMIVDTAKNIRHGISEGDTKDEKKLNDDGSERVEVKIVKKK